jgi:hypothetical protein
VRHVAEGVQLCSVLWHLDIHAPFFFFSCEFSTQISKVMHAWDNITSAAAAAGKPIAVFGEMERYHFSEHDVYPTSTDLAKDFVPPPAPPPGNDTTTSDCFKSVMLSCHDGGFDQGPGNYYGVRGSRAKLGYQALFSWFIPVLFSGDEANLDPVYLPALKQGCYSGGSPGGWLYGSQLEWGQISSDPAKAAMLHDTSRMMHIRRNESDVIHANMCTSHILRVPFVTTNTTTTSAASTVANDTYDSRLSDRDSGGAPVQYWTPYAR